MYTLHILVRTDARKLSEYSEFELGGKFSTMLSSSTPFTFSLERTRRNCLNILNKKGLTRGDMDTMKGAGNFRHLAAKFAGI